MKLTIEQRIQALERQLAILTDKIELIHRMVKNMRNTQRDFLREKLQEAK